MPTPLILASQSQGRLEILKNIGLMPDRIIPANIDETPLKSEKPNALVERLAVSKARHVANHIDDGYVIGADTIVWCRHQILGKAHSDDDVRMYMELLSGRRYEVYTGVAVARVVNKKLDKIASRVVTTKLKFKRFTQQEMREYISSKEGIGKAGGISSMRRAAGYLQWMNGSPTAVIGLPAYETKMLLLGLGYNEQAPSKK